MVSIPHIRGGRRARSPCHPTRLATRTARRYPLRGEVDPGPTVSRRQSPPRTVFALQRRRRRPYRTALAATTITISIAIAAALLLDDGGGDPAPAEAGLAQAIAAQPAADQAAAAAPAEGTPPQDTAVPASAAPAGATPEPPTTAPSTPAAQALPQAPTATSANSAQPATPAPTIPTPAVSVRPGTIRQGETALVVLSGDVVAEQAFVSIDGFTGPMVREGEDWIGYLPLSPLAAARHYNVVVDIFNGGAYDRTFLGDLVVVEAQAGVEQITLDPETAALLSPELVAVDNETRFQRFREVSGPRLWDGPWTIPTAGEAEAAFGVLRSYNGAPATDWHHGYDISAETGTPIAAPAAGRVVFAQELPVHGLGVILDHGAGVYSGYWHMSQIEVSSGQAVTPGDLLGRVGTSGLSTGSHLHWEVIVQGHDVDPIQWTASALSQ